MAREFKKLTQAPGVSGDFYTVDGYLKHKGLCLLKQVSYMPDRFEMPSYEDYPKINDDMQRILDAIQGPEVLFLGGGVNSFAKAIHGETGINKIDCVEIHQDVINLMDGAIFDNIFNANAYTYNPVQHYDCIVLDIFYRKGVTYDADRERLKTKYEAQLKTGGVYLELNF